jgi:hypothetical protein
MSAASLSNVSSAISNHSNSTTHTSAQISHVDQVATAATSDSASQPPVLPAGLWLRAVLGFEAPFGFDGMPTVWG